MRRMTGAEAPVDLRRRTRSARGLVRPPLDGAVFRGPSNRFDVDNPPAGPPGAVRRSSMFPIVDGLWSQSFGFLAPCLGCFVEIFLFFSQVIFFLCSLDLFLVSRFLVFSVRTGFWGVLSVRMGFWFATGRHQCISCPLSNRPFVKAKSGRVPPGLAQWGRTPTWSRTGRFFASSHCQVLLIKEDPWAARKAEKR